MSEILNDRNRHTKLQIALLVLLTVSAALITLSIEPSFTLGVSLALGLSFVGLGTGLIAGRRIRVPDLVIPLTVASCFSTLALWSPLGKSAYGAIRHVDIGVSIEPAGLWIISCHLAATAYFTGKTHGIWLAANLAGAIGSALLMPELSLIPQIVVGTVIIAWLQGQKRVALIVISIVVMAVAASAAFPYVQQRWIGFLDPVGHALSAGYDYQAITRAVTESQWFGRSASNLPAMSSPTDDYWLAAGCFQVGRLGMILWVMLFIGTLIFALRIRQGSEEKGLLLRATCATLILSLLVHAGYNLGFIPVTATYPPLAGLSGSISASQLFLLGYCVMDNAESEKKHSDSA